MRGNVLDFIRRGLMACGFGPLVLMVVYLILQQEAGLETLTVQQVCRGILSLTALAFLAGGMNVIYQIERLPLMAAISIHGGVLYGGYLATYLFNDWLDGGVTPILVFTGIFLVCYVVVWIIIYSVTRNKTEKLNAILREQQNRAEKR